ncbi:MAG: hydrogenase expression/formation protein HypE [Gemmatimonadetes bacterium]|uniref:Hydrogenase expression/formation protein HypE n=1 Tax=Candidatus Kutchimonas denitrificans TaxID=3056748 RepID=A0AAE4Z953_9BACT|nr:hydrogenase expression/formation protein HypE [Gemmatimonadota bacterium]NIR74752.1 hydrogenase expression/formation protein HypE [Candidatus Kutchimonas denitrificans]NIS01502.1 hydrogenase expression/formation protein HypE [Gemmatimonadota bacterium]NIT67243.1 hydrogenase expression/formation protein HypE [Gemmatimonadota bacterium]NIU52417.1 hydrogenase expression/formation protein HypE [Gemmatimonadota bacterium]
MSDRVGEKYGVLGERVTLKHGAGGRAMRMLIEDKLAAGFAPLADGEIGLAAMDDGAAFRLGDGWLVVTTDSHVIHPVFFPGGDIGRLAVAGTVNDLAVMGATDVLGLTSAMVIEEGFPQSDLERIQRSMQETCQEAGVTIVTGDTKVMGKGELDGIIINTTGVGLAESIVSDSGLNPGDRIVLTGPIGEHGIALMAARRGLGLEGDLRSDVAPINDLIRTARGAADGSIVAMKDPTRGGLASALTEMAEKSGVGIVIDEASVPVTDVVRAAAEILGLDPFHIANEGKAVIGVRPNAADAVLTALRSNPQGKDAAIVGTCIDEHRGRLILDTGFGRRLVSEPEGEPLPRIC